MSLIGLDIGTAGCRAIVFREDGEILGQCAREYSIRSPHPGWAEQDAERVWQIAWQSLEDALSEAGRDDPPQAMALSVQGEAVIPVDRSGYSMRYAILGMDTRTTAENQWLSERFGAEPLFHQTGMPIHTINTLPKLLWLQKNEPDLWKNAACFHLYEDFFLRRFCGEASIGHCLASRTQLYDLVKGDWADDILEPCGIDRSRLAPLAPLQGGVIGSLRPQLAHELGIHHEMPLVSGGHDQACAALGSGAIRAGSAMVSTGTAEVVEMVMDSPALTEPLRRGNISVYRHVVPGLYLAMTLNHSGGLLLRWFRDSFCEEQLKEARASGRDAYDLILDGAPEEPTDLLVLPHFAGSGTPWMDTASRGAILGLTFSTNRASLAKAILEGLTFELRINLDLLKEGGIPIRELHAVGGGAKSPLWLQLKADICNIPLTYPQVTEAACLGAALLAGRGVNLYSDFDDAVRRTVRNAAQCQPNPGRVRQYDSLFTAYQRLYPTLRGLYASGEDS